MRQYMVTCFSEHAVRISELTCSSSSSTSTSSSTFLHQISPNSSNLSPTSPSVQNAVVYLYKTPLILSPQNNDHHLLITVTWCRNQLTGQGGLSITFHSSLSSPASFKLNSFSRLFRRKKGQKTIEVDSSKIDIFWDLSQATYHSGPEPIDGYYVLVTSGSQLGLALGDLAHEAAASHRLRPGPTRPNAALISRREHYSGANNSNNNNNNAATLYCSTAAQFCESGGPHEIVIRCGEEHGLQKQHHHQPVLSVSIDKRTVIKIRRLQWNFRGNQTVFVDGVLVDLMWDVHDWFFGSGQAVFMFKTRSGLDSSRLWLEEKLGHKDNTNNHNNQDSGDFSLLIIYASKNP